MKAIDHAQTVSRLAALAQETRLALFRQLVEAGPAGMTPGVLAERLEVAAPTLSFHLKELARNGLIRAEQQGRYVVYTADFAVMNGLIGYLSENCCRMSCGSDCVTPPVKGANHVDANRAQGRGAGPVRRGRTTR